MILVPPSLTAEDSDEAPVVQYQVLPPQFLKALADLESRYSIVLGSGTFKKSFYCEKDNTWWTSVGKFEFALKPGMARTNFATIDILNRQGRKDRREGGVSLLFAGNYYSLKRLTPGGPYEVDDQKRVDPKSPFFVTRGIDLSLQCPYGFEAGNLSALIADEDHVLVRRERVDYKGKSMLRLEFGPSKVLWETMDKARRKLGRFTLSVVVSPEQGWAIHRVTSYLNNMCHCHIMCVHVGKLEYIRRYEGTPVLSRYTLRFYQPMENGEKIQLGDGQEIVGVFLGENDGLFDKIRFEPDPDNSLELSTDGLSAPDRP